MPEINFLSTKPLPSKSSSLLPPRSVFVLAGGVNNLQCYCGVRMCSRSCRVFPISSQRHQADKTTHHLKGSSFQLVIFLFEITQPQHIFTKPPVFTLCCKHARATMFNQMHADVQPWTWSWSQTHSLLQSWFSGCCHGWFGSPAPWCPAGLEEKQQQQQGGGEMSRQTVLCTCTVLTGQKKAIHHTETMLLFQNSYSNTSADIY